MVEALCVDPKLVHSFWPRVKPWIAEAIRRGGGDNLDGTERDVLAGRALLWIVWDGQNIKGAAVTELLFGGICQIIAYGGSRPGRLIKVIEKYAVDEGCNRVRFTGRRGWSRLYPEYHQPYIVLERRL